MAANITSVQNVIRYASLIQSFVSCFHHDIFQDFLIYLKVKKIGTLPVTYNISEGQPSQSQTIGALELVGRREVQHNELNRQENFEWVPEFTGMIYNSFITGMIYNNFIY